MDRSDRNRPAEALFELFLWQGLHPEFNDDRLDAPQKNESVLFLVSSKELVLLTYNSGAIDCVNVMVPLVEYTIQCRVRSAEVLQLDNTRVHQTRSCALKTLSARHLGTDRTQAATEPKSEDGNIWYSLAIGSNTVPNTHRTRGTEPQKYAEGTPGSNTNT